MVDRRAARDLRLLVVFLLLAACGSTQAPTPTTSSIPSPRTAQPSELATTPPTTAPLPTATPTPTPTGTQAQPTTEVPTDPPTPFGTPAPLSDVVLSVELFADVVDPLILATNAGDGSGLLYAVGQHGVISVVSADGIVREAPFLDIDARVKSGGEQGLLGLAFHPDYESNGRLFVNYTNLNGDTVVSEFARAGDPAAAVADAGSESILLTIDQPFANHNGGMIAFGADGYLYIGMGDGGSGGDPQGNGQSPTTLLGKMLRIDIDSGDLYGIPADNPFVDGSALPEIWAFGLRNPWRFSFDRETGAMFIGDVGQGAAEEIDAAPAGAGGRNYGWDTMEGDICFAADECDTDGLTMPVAVNDRSRGECAVTGGYVYRGAAYPQLTGAYVFSDYCTGALWALDATAAIASGRAEALILGQAGFEVSSFGEDESGELYVVNLRGEVHRLVAAIR